MPKTSWFQISIVNTDTSPGATYTIYQDTGVIKPPYQLEWGENPQITALDITAAYNNQVNYNQMISQYPSHVDLIEAQVAASNDKPALMAQLVQNVAALKQRYNNPVAPVTAIPIMPNTAG